MVPFQCRIRVSELPWLILLVLPTAQAFRAEVAATAESRALAPGLGLDTLFHAVLFHRKVRVFVGPSPLPVSPTGPDGTRGDGGHAGQQGTAPGVGLGTYFHAAPFHRSVTLKPGPDPQLASPTVQAPPAEVTATAPRYSASPWLAPGSGLGTRIHAVPFHRSISVLSLEPKIVEPTAQALPAELAATPSRVASDPGLGLDIRFHAAPFHRSISVLPLLV